MKTISDRAHGGDISGLGQVIDFSANINPLGLSPKSKEAVIKNIFQVENYPEPDSKSLKKDLSDFHHLTPDNLTIGNGSIELIYLIPQALKTKRVLIITPTFSEYEFASQAYGAKILYFKTEEKDNFKIEIDKIRAYFSGIDLVFLCNPNNPTGSCLAGEGLAEFLRVCLKPNLILAIDEAFADFVRELQVDGLIPSVIKIRNLIILRSITKFFALPGLRIGYAIGHRDMIRKITKLQYPWNVNSLAQSAARAVLRDKKFMSRTRRYVGEEKERLFQGLKELGSLKVFYPSSNFILCKLENSGIKSAQVLNARLIKKGMLVRDCANFRGLNEKFFRVAVRRRKDNLNLLKAMRGILSNEG